MIISLNLKEDSYEIALGRGNLEKAGELLNLDRKVLIVTDDGVPAVYAETVARQCEKAIVVTLASGEASKNLENFRRLLSAMLKESFTRKDCVVAVGGGVIGDLSGFAAACYMRGIDFYNIPTTLLSQVDSSIGGKTAIDLDGVKNIVGAFYQPKKVLIDPDTLKTLDERQISAGLAEAIKMSLTSDPVLFAKIRASQNLENDLEEIIAGALKIKRDIVEKDPKEQGVRKILNFGHTIGHGIESFYEGKLLHGECVALGMLPMCGEGVRKELIPVLEKYHLPTTVEADADQLMPFILHDKKMQKEKVQAVFVNQIGSFEIRETTPEEIRRYINL
ncbi:MAG: 3-dehydroquinate synthase [Parasporobacterium sp.]|nr:3-dehydroquinate synthase [Parasporobacterium sp.]